MTFANKLISNNYHQNTHRNILTLIPRLWRCLIQLLIVLYIHCCPPCQSGRSWGWCDTGQGPLSARHSSCWGDTSQGRRGSVWSHWLDQCTLHRHLQYRSIREKLIEFRVPQTELLVEFRNVMMITWRGFQKHNYLHTFCHQNEVHNQFCIHIWSCPGCWHKCGHSHDGR